jgi:hypothetical protein
MKGSPKPPAWQAQHKSCLRGNKCVEPHPDVLIAELAERQHGVVTLTQLQSLGLGRSGVSRRAKAGRLHRVYSGVYALGRPTLTQHGRWMAAVLAYGPRAVLSHRSAAALHGLRPDNRARVDVSVPSPSARARPGIAVHRTLTLTKADVTTVHGIPCTRVARTLIDLGDDVPIRGVEQAVDQAEVLRLFDGRTVEAALERAGPRRGAGTVRTVLARYEGPTLTDRDLEERFLALCRGASLPSPAVNAWVTLNDGVVYKADFMWRKEKLIVETDGRDVHTTRRAFEHDRLRDQRLALAGFTVVRFTWRQVVDDPRGVAETLRGLLARLARP